MLPSHYSSFTMDMQAACRRRTVRGRSWTVRRLRTQACTGGFASLGVYDSGHEINY